MSDDLPTADEPEVVEPAEQSESVADEAVSSQESPPPWGEDFDPQRAWSTIQHQRQREVELEQQVKEFSRLREDPDALNQFLSELGYELADTDEDEDPEFDPDDPFQKLEALEQKILEREQREHEAAEKAQLAQAVEMATKRMEEDLDAIGGLDELQREWIVEKALTLEPTAEGVPDIKAAYAKYTALVDAEKKRWAGSKDTSHVSPVGTSANQVPDLSDETQRHAWMQERYAAKLRDA